MTALLWLRRDLRLHDHPALRAALDDGGALVPVFCFDPRLLSGRHASAARARFLRESLEELAESLRRRGSGLVLRQGRPEQILASLATELHVTRVFWTGDVGPFATRRDQAVRRELGSIGVEVHVLPGLFVLDDPSALLSSAGRPYQVFTPFHRAWIESGRRQILPTPRSLPALPSSLDPGGLPRLGLERVNEQPVRGGEGEGRRRMHRFLAAGVGDYHVRRDDLGADASSRLSAYLHFGCISARELEARLPAGAGGQEFRRQLCWRDFYAHVLAHFPANARQEFQERYRGSVRWSRAESRFEAWCNGRTGYPLVDAAMRQLGLEGWLHNRGRLVVGSFLTKDLGLDWRWGERWFMRMLIDGDEANNNGNWQWIASVGVDPQPPFRRIYNPSRQQRRFDPTGAYVRRYVPELRGVPDEYLAEPWSMPTAVQRASACVIGRDYPAPIVDHAVARREALARYAEAAVRGRPASPSSRQAGLVSTSCTSQIRRSAKPASQ
ncbi:MAG TPA: deoxyribodipyrimidine photo-lyase [Solirubrobacteraceae bacterium]|nr:deoxyribodipyrimidine photo-lyase [Solirubrobacteraceae bacterium]